MSEQITQWQYPLLEVTENKRSGRSGVSPGEAYELIGVDGSVEGGISPFPGFRAVADLAPQEEENNPNLFNGSATPTGHDWLTGEPVDPGWYIDEFKGVTFRIGASSYAYGFVYRVRFGAGVTLLNPLGNYHYFIQYYVNQESTVYVRELTNFEEVADETPGPWDVVVFGRMIYLLVEGELPVLFYVEEDLTVPEVPVYSEYCVGGVGTGTTTGPGAQPVLYPHDHSQTIGTILSTPTAPGTAQIVLTTLPPSLLPVTWPGAVPQADFDVRTLEPGDYAFAYQLLDSRTGRKSKLSQIAPIQTVNFDPNAAGGGSSGSLASTDETDVNKYAIIEIAYDKAKYDKLMVYRSVLTQKAGGTFVAGILHLEGIIDLETYWVDSNPGGTTGHALYYYTLEDKALVWQETYLDARSDFDNEMPRAGCGIIHDGAMLLSGIRRQEGEAEVPVNRGLGELRWSSLADIGVELFPVISKYIPTVASNQIITFSGVGSNMVGFSRDRQYLIRKEGLYLKVLEMHEGFGVVNRKAVASVGNLSYFLSEKGLKAVTTDGQLDDVRALNNYFLSEWRERLLECKVSFDPAAGALFVLLPCEEYNGNDDERERATPGRAAVLWFNTARVTEVVDLPFWDSCEGEWPVATTTTGRITTDRDSSLVRRSFFLQSFGVGAAGTHRVYTTDYTKSKLIYGAGVNSGERRTTLLDTTGDARFTVLLTAAGVGTKGSFSTVVDGGIKGTDWAEARAYVLASDSNPENVGRSSKIFRVVGSSIHVDHIGTFNPGDRVGISPVYMRVVGWQVGLQDPEGAAFGGRDFFRIRHVDAMGVAFTEVTGPNDGTADAKVYLGMYKGNDEEPLFRVWGKDTTGNETVTIEDGESIYYGAMSTEYGYDSSSLYPYVEVMCPDLEYRLLALRVTGKIRDTVRSRRPS